MAGALVEPTERHDGALAAGPPLTDWTLRPFAASARPLLAVGVCYGAAFLALSLAQRVAASELSLRFWTDSYFWLDVLNAALFAYAPVATMFLRRGRLRDLRELRPSLDVDDAGFARLQAQTVSVPPRRLLAAGLAIAIPLGAMPLLDPRFWPEGPPESLPMMFFFVMRSAATGWLFGHTLATDVTGGSSMRRIGTRALRVDLFDPDAAAPVVRSGLRSAFTWVLLSSLVSLFWLGPAPGSSNGVIVAGILSAVAFGFFFTIHGVRRGRVAAKQQALSGLNARIREAGERLLEGRGRDEGPALADLIAFHSYLDRVREWPLGAPTLLRGALIAALAVGSWMGGALVERLLDQAF